MRSCLHNRRPFFHSSKARYAPTAPRLPSNEAAAPSTLSHFLVFPCAALCTCLTSPPPPLPSKHKHDAAHKVVCLSTTTPLPSSHPPHPLCSPPCLSLSLLCARHFLISLDPLGFGIAALVKKTSSSWVFCHHHTTFLGGFPATTRTHRAPLFCALPAFSTTTPPTTQFPLSSRFDSLHLRARHPFFTLCFDLQHARLFRASQLLFLGHGAEVDVCFAREDVLCCARVCAHTHPEHFLSTHLEKTPILQRFQANRRRSFDPPRNTRPCNTTRVRLCVRAAACIPTLP